MQLGGRKVSRALGRRTTGTDTYSEELLELGAVVERGDVHGEAKQVFCPLPPFLDHGGFEPACSRQHKRWGEKQ